MKRFLTLLCLSLIFIPFSNCSEIVVPESDSDLNVEDLESAWDHINTTYPLFDFKGIDWNGIHTEYRARAEQAAGDEIYTVLLDLVGELKDGHAKIYTEGGLSVRPFTPPRLLRDEKAFNPNLIRRYFDNPLRLVGENAIEYGFLPDNVGYVRISTFGGVLREDDHVKDIDIVIDHLFEADGLIVDVRNNRGGGSFVNDQITGRLINQPIGTESAFSRMHTRQPYTIEPQGPRQYTGPIVILINGTSFSATEVFAERMRQLDHVTLIGDTTAGGGVSSNEDPRHFLPSGKSIHINYEAILRIDGEPLEWNGVPPDIRVSQTTTDVQKKRDKQLEFAMEFLSGQ